MTAVSIVVEERDFLQRQYDQARERAEKVERTATILANRLACIQSGHDLDPAKRDWETGQYLQWAAEQAAKGEE